MEADENLAAADDGSPGEEKSEALTDFFLWSWRYDTTIRTELCKLWWTNRIILVFRQSNGPFINSTVTSLEQELYL